jgi:hypothetical protein
LTAFSLRAGPFGAVFDQLAPRNARDSLPRVVRYHHGFATAIAQVNEDLDDV